MARKPAKKRPIKSTELKFSKLFEPNIETGQLFFNQRRVVLFDIEALGALRKQLIETLGEELAMGVLTRFGYESGYNDAKTLGHLFEWETETDWLAAGPVLHILEGVVNVKPEKIEFDRQTGHFHMHGIWDNSYEAEIHLKTQGLSNRPACWTLTGYASGYASHFFGRRLLAIETECVGKGDKRCYWEIRPENEWGDEAKRYIKALKAANIATHLQQLQLVGARFHDIAISSADWVWETDAELRYVYCSERIADVLGYGVEQVLGKTNFDFMPQEEALRIKQIFADILARKGSIVDLETSILTPDGRERIVLINGIPIIDETDTLTGYRGVTKNITERKRAEESLQASEERFRALTESTSDWIWEIDQYGIYTYASPKVKDLLGYEPNEIIGRMPFDFMPEEEAQRISEIFNPIMESRKPFATLENTTLHKDGRRVILETSGVPIFDKDGNFVGYRGIDRDITERKKAEEEIMKNLSLLNSTIESTADGILVVDREGKIVRFNQKFVQMWNIPESIMESRDDNKALSFVLDQMKDPESFLSKVKELYALPNEKSFDVIEFKDGRYFERYSQPQEIEGKILGRVWGFRDVTDRKEALIALEKSEAELKKRVKELEEFYNLAVGRELRMIELKNEIARLKEDL